MFNSERGRNNWTFDEWKNLKNKTKSKTLLLMNETKEKKTKNMHLNLNLNLILNVNVGWHFHDWDRWQLKLMALVRSFTGEKKKKENFSPKIFKLIIGFTFLLFSKKLHFVKRFLICCGMVNACPTWLYNYFDFMF